jgi:hypothetical protein
MFENKVPRKILESKKNEVTRNWRSLHDEELHDMCSSLHIIRASKLS